MSAVQGSDAVDIRHYYYKFSEIHLNSSLLTVLFAAGFLAFAVFLSIPYIWTATPVFMFLSILSFGRHIMYRKKGASVPAKVGLHEGPLLNEKNVLMAFLPSAALHMLLFHPNGRLLGVIKDQPKQWRFSVLPYFATQFFSRTYVLENQHGELLATFKTGGILQNNMKVFGGGGEFLGQYKESTRDSFIRYKGLFLQRDGETVADVDVSPFLHTFSLASTDGVPIASYQKGYLPMEWANKFKPNTPVLSFSESASTVQQLYAYGICTRLFAYKST